MVKNRSLTKKEAIKNMDGLIITCRYACNCEKSLMFGLSKKLKNFISEQKNPEEIKKKLKLLDIYKFYRAIAKTNKILDPFDWRVVSYYWKGAPTLQGEMWHNYTTLIPILKLPIKYIDLSLINKCFVHPAKTIKVEREWLVVEYRPVVKKGNELLISKKLIKEKIKNNLEGKIFIGKYLTIHYSEAVEIINEQEYQSLIQINYRSLEKFNSERNKKAKKK